MTTCMKLLEAKAFWGVDELQARLVAAVDERDAARKLYDERQDDWIAERESLQALNMQLVKNHDAMQAERDAALKRATEARETADNYAGHCDKACKQLEAVEAERDAQSALVDQAVKALAEMNNANGKLMMDLAAVMNERDAAQAEAARAVEALKAVAEWIEKEAAALRAGKVEND